MVLLGVLTKAVLWVVLAKDVVETVVLVLAEDVVEIVVVLVLVVVLTRAVVIEPILT